MRTTSASPTLLLMLNGRADSLLYAFGTSSAAFLTPGRPKHHQSRVPFVSKRDCTFLNEGVLCGRQLYHLRPLQIKANKKRSMTVLKEGSSSQKEMELEVEQKFALPTSSSVTSIERKLSSLGFERIGKKTEFTDWYFDLPAPYWSLTLQDCWFRYREVKIGDKGSWGWKGSWQLKRGRQMNSAGGGATVYEEIEGQDAVDTALSILANDEKVDAEECKIDSANYSYEGFDTPHLPESCNLVPFARFETRRTCWAITNLDSSGYDIDSDFVGLTVELDGTNFGYMVGEVETIVYSEDKVANAKDRVAKLVSELGSNSKDEEGENKERISSVPTAGKLETYMMEHRRDHYDACIEAGVMGSGP